MDLQSQKRKAKIESQNDMRLIKLGALLGFRKAFTKLFECSKLYIKLEQGDDELPRANVVTKHRSYPNLMMTLGEELAALKYGDNVLEFLGLQDIDLDEPGG